MHLPPTGIGEVIDALDSHDGADDRLAAGVDDSTGDGKIGGEVEVVGVLGSNDQIWFLANGRATRHL